MLTSNHLVEDVVVSLIAGLEHDSRQLQQVVLNDAATDLETVVEANLDELSKARAVVIANGSCIAYMTE